MSREQRALETPVSAGERIFTGRPVVYNSFSQLICGAFQERIMPGAFDEAIGGDIIACIEHDSARILGRTASGTLKIASDDTGLAIEVSDPETSYSADLRKAIMRGDIRGMSFIFDVLSDRWYQQDGVTTRDVMKANLYEVSFVTNPAYLDTEAAARSVERAVSVSRYAETLNRYRRFLRLIEAD